MSARLGEHIRSNLATYLVLAAIVAAAALLAAAAASMLTLRFGGRGTAAA